MKRAWMALLFAALLALGIPLGASALAEEERADWTVLFYFCGSDLESKYSYATDNFEEISNVKYPDSYLPFAFEWYGVERDVGALKQPGTVNILIQTGGAKEWHTQRLEMDRGLDIDAGAVQRWRYACYPFGGQDSQGPFDGYELCQTLPLQSMADPQTLTDFIRWGAENYPAEKYVLVLWDHGGGAKTGLFIDELFEGDVMYLYELKQALLDAGVHFEDVIIDACMMANIETAWAIKDSARWMVASEEVVPGKGTAIGDWLQELVSHADQDGEWLARCVCDMTCVKYANEADGMGKSLLTWSVVDLTKIDALVEATGQFFHDMGDALRFYPGVARLEAACILKLQEYGEGPQDMRDIGGLLYGQELEYNMDIGTLDEMMRSLKDAVEYAVRGTGRSASWGLSFCYPQDFDEAELDIYAKNFPLAPYLAFLDAVSTWTAPDWVYEQTERLPEIDDIEGLQIKARREVSAGGVPALNLGDTEFNANGVFYRLYRQDEETGAVIRLGRTACACETAEDFSLQWRAADPMHWPAIEGVLCCIDLVQNEDVRRLYNIPAQIDSKEAILRCGREIDYSDDRRISTYEVFGVWNGYDENSILMNRSVQPLATLAGQDFQLLYPTDFTDEGGKTMYQASETLTMYRALDVEEIPLPPGTYYIEYEVEDMFQRPFVFERIEVQWDGERMTFPHLDAWTGETTLTKKGE